LKGFRAQIVISTVLLVAAAMFAVVLGTEVVLELSEGRPKAHSSFDILVASSFVGVFGVVAAAAVALTVSHRALAPVRQMAERAEEWSAQDLAHRFDLGPPKNELSQLGQTLDHLLDRVARAIRDEQRLTSELAHELRTPLTAIQGSAELALMRPAGDPGLREDLTEIASGARRMSEVVTTLLELARSPESFRGSVDPGYVVQQVAGLVRPPLVLSVSGSAAPVAAPSALAVRALSPLIENAARFARASVTVSVRRRLDQVEIAVSDDGPGVAPELRDTIFEPGASGRGSSGLGLGIARRIARSLGGDVTLEGSEFVLRLPRA
jgi:signal transduction histidine kinase